MAKKQEENTQNLEIEYINKGDLKPYANNAKLHPAEQIDQIKKSIKEFGMNDPIAVWGDNEIVEGHGRLLAIMEMRDIQDVPVIRLDNLTDEQRRAYALVHNKLTMNSDFDIDLLNTEMESLTGIDFEEYGFVKEDENLFEEDKRLKYERTKDGVLRTKFVAPPFSVLDSRQGYWKDRKQEWHEVLPDSREGRSDILLGEGLYKLAQRSGKKNLTGTSEFDPVLCEILYQWFAPEGGTVIDPFAGGHIRGTIADIVGLKYTGIDLRPEQVEVNNDVKEEYGIQNATWICDDSLNVDKYIEDGSADFMIACPPYADLEQYSDDPRDISTMKYDQFIKVYGDIIAKFINKLKDNTFASFVVGDVRDRKGFYYDFISDTKKIFIEHGMRLYNEIILIESMATSALRAHNFTVGRKVVKGHQNVLVFYKGEQAEQKKHVLVFYKGNPKNIKEYEVSDKSTVPIKGDEEGREALRDINKMVNKTEEEPEIWEDRT